MKWIYKKAKTDTFSPDIKKTTLNLRSFYATQIKVDDDIILLVQDYINGWVFDSHWRVKSVLNKDDDPKHFIVDIALKETFKSKKKLIDYMYSLRRITDFENPVIHFITLVRIQDIEFKAIVEGKIYYSRTAFGVIFNAMHIDHRKAFLLYLSDYLQIDIFTIQQMKFDYESFKFLLEYLQECIIQPAKYLKDSMEILKKIIPKDEISGIYFGIPKNEKESEFEKFMLEKQVERIEKYLDILDSLQKMSQSYLKNDREFLELFKNSSLPISLKP